MIDLTPYQLEIVLDILKKYVPFCEVRVFGSRYKWTSKNYSDLDLAIVGNKKLDKKIIHDLKEAFSESDLPIRVDVLDWYAISDEFKQIINQGYEVIQKREKQLPDGWEIKKLGDVIDMTTGKLNANQAVDKGMYPFFTCAPEPYRINEFNFDCNAVLLAGNNANGTFHVNRYCGKFNAYQRTYVITVNHNNDINFIYYKLKNIISDFIGTSQGSATKFLTRPLIENKLIELPPLPIQEQIASILSVLDEKINTNNQINNKLEEIAQALFKHWFIDFNFPDENCTPYKDSGGAMIDSELGKIPKGWHIKNLDEIATFTNGLAMQKHRPKDNEQSLPVVKIKELRQGCFDDSSDRCSYNIASTYKLVNGDVVFSWSGTLLVDMWCGGMCGLNQHLFKITSDSYPKWFYYCWTKHYLEYFIGVAQDKATTMGHIQRKHLSNAKVLIPDTVQLKKLNATISPTVEYFVNTRVESKKLETIRNSLLPKLMSGEIDVTHGV